MPKFVRLGIFSGIPSLSNTGSGKRRAYRSGMSAPSSSLISWTRCSKSANIVFEDEFPAPRRRVWNLEDRVVVVTREGQWFVRSSMSKRLEGSSGTVVAAWTSLSPPNSNSGGSPSDHHQDRSLLARRTHSGRMEAQSCADMELKYYSCYRETHI